MKVIQMCLKMFSSLQEAAGPRAVVLLQTEHVPQPAVQISEGRRRGAEGQSLCEAAAAGQRRAERQLHLRSALPRVRGHEGEARHQNASAGRRGEKTGFQVYIQSLPFTRPPKTLKQSTTASISTTSLQLRS